MNCTPFVRQVWYHTCTKKWGVFLYLKKRFIGQYKQILAVTMMQKTQLQWNCPTIWYIRSCAHQTVGTDLSNGKTGEPDYWASWSSNSKKWITLSARVWTHGPLPIRTDWIDWLLKQSAYQAEKKGLATCITQPASPFSSWNPWIWNICLTFRVTLISPLLFRTLYTAPFCAIVTTQNRI